MTEDQRRHALALCESILATAAKLQADLRAAAEVIEAEIGTTHSISGHREAAKRVT